MLKIVSVIGARPQFIKAVMVSRAILTSSTPIEEKVIHTGQHFDDNMSEIFFRELEISKPDYHLGVGGGTHGQNTGRMIEKIETFAPQDATHDGLENCEIIAEAKALIEKRKERIAYVETQWLKTFGD